MVDLLIRNIGEDDVQRLDQQAAHTGVSRAELLRRIVAQAARRGTGTVITSDFDKFALLGDESLTREAW